MYTSGVCVCVCYIVLNTGSLVRLFYHAFMHENALNPVIFPSLRHFETEIVAMVAHMLHGNGDVVGSVTSGGTESILMAVKTYRDRAVSLYSHITHPEMVCVCDCVCVCVCACVRVYTCMYQYHLLPPSLDHR